MIKYVCKWVLVEFKVTKDLKTGSITTLPQSLAHK